MEDTSYCPVRKQQINYDWSDVQTTEFEEPVNSWGPVQTTQYEEPVNNWEPVQTTPIAKEILTTRYEAQNHTWSPVQTTRYGPPVFYGAPSQPLDAEYNMALRHQVFDESEDGSVKGIDDNEADDNGGEGGSNDATIPLTPEDVTPRDDVNDGGKAVDGDMKTDEGDSNARPKTSESEASHTPPATPSSPSKGILRPARRNSSPVSVHFTEDTLPPAPGPPEPPETPNSPKFADKPDKKSKNKSIKKDKRSEKKVEKKVERKAKEKAPEPAKHIESEKEVKIELPAQVEETDSAEKPGKSGKSSKPEKASKSSSKNQKKRGTGGKGKDKGKSRAVIAPIVPGTSDVVLSDGTTVPLTEPTQSEPDSLDESLSSSDPPSESEPSPEVTIENAEPSGPLLPTEVKETSEPVVNDSPLPSDSLTTPEPIESSEAPVESDQAPFNDIEQPSESTEPSVSALTSESDKQPGAAEISDQPGEGESPATPPDLEPLVESGSPLPPAESENGDESNEITHGAAPEPVEQYQKSTEALAPDNVEGSQGSNEASIPNNVAENNDSNEAPDPVDVEESTAPPMNDEGPETVPGEHVEITDSAGDKNSEDATKAIESEPEIVASTIPPPSNDVEESAGTPSNNGANDTPKDFEPSVEISEPEDQERGNLNESPSSEELVKDDPVLKPEIAQNATPEETIIESTQCFSEETPLAQIEPSDSTQEPISEAETNLSETLREESEEPTSGIMLVEEGKLEESSNEKLPAVENVTSETKSEETTSDGNPREVAESTAEMKCEDLSGEAQEAGSDLDTEGDEIKTEKVEKSAETEPTAPSDAPEPSSESTEEAKGAETEPNAPSEHAEPPSPETNEEEKSTETEPSASSEDEEALAPESETVEGAKDELARESSESGAKEEIPGSIDDTTPTPSQEETEDVKDDVPASQDPIIESRSDEIEIIEAPLDASSQEPVVDLSAASEQPANERSCEPPSSVETAEEAEPGSEGALTEPETSADDEIKAVEQASKLEIPVEDAKDIQEPELANVETNNPQEEIKVDESVPTTEHDPESKSELEDSSGEPTPVVAEVQTIQPALETNDAPEVKEQEPNLTVQESAERASENDRALIDEKPAPEVEETKVEEAAPCELEITSGAANAEEHVQGEEVQADKIIPPATEESPPQEDEALQPKETTDSKPEDTEEPKPEPEGPVVEEATQENPKSEPETPISEEAPEPVTADQAEDSGSDRLVEQQSNEDDEEKNNDPTPVPDDTFAEVNEDSKDGEKAPDEPESTALVTEDGKALDTADEPEVLGQDEKQEEEAPLSPEDVQKVENTTPENAEPSEPVPAIEEIHNPPSGDPPKGEPELPKEEVAAEPMPESEGPVETAAPPSGDTPQSALEAPHVETASTPTLECQESASEVTPNIKPEPSKEAAPVLLSDETVEATPESEELPLAEIAAGIAVGAIAATVLEAKDPPAEPEAHLSHKTVFDEPEQLAQVIEEPASGEPPSPISNKHRKHRSSRHSKSSSRQSSSRDGPSEEFRPPLHHKRRESENSLKNLFFAPPLPRKPSRHDSGFSAESSSPHSRKHRSDRTPEEQAAHEQRKTARKAAKARAVEAENANADEPATELASFLIPTRKSSTRRYSSSRSSNTRDDDEKKPKLLDMKGESVIKAKLIAIDKPHIKETVLKSTTKPIPIIDRPRFSMDGERPKYLERSNSSRHQNSHRSSNRNEREDRDRHKIEERELRKAREETKRQVERAQAAVAEESRKQQERDDEERKLKREARRKRREEEERANEGSPETATVRSKGKLVNDNLRHHSHRSEREKESQRERSKSNGPLKSLWSSAKKVFT